MLFAAAFAFMFLLVWGIVAVAGPPLERLLARTAHWAADFRFGDYLPVVLLISGGVGAAAVIGDLFVDIAERVQSQSPALQAIDTRIHEWATTTRTSGATVFFVAMTTLGAPAVLALIVAIVTAVLMAKRRYRWAAYLVFTTAVGGLLNVELKVFFSRSRPALAEALRDATGYAFPSGHAMGSAVVFGALAYLAFRGIRNWKWRSAAVSTAVTAVVAIALSRVYLGVHWISDVGGGIAAGVIWVATTTLAYEAFRRIRLVRALRRLRKS